MLYEVITRKVIDVNLNGAFYCMRYEIPQMVDQGSGAIVSVITSYRIHYTKLYEQRLARVSEIPVDERIVRLRAGRRLEEA